MIAKQFAFLALIGAFSIVSAETKPITLKDVPDELQEISSDEPFATNFSAEKAATYLDQAALTWQKKKKCATCHTTMSYLMARPALSEAVKDSGEVRAFFEDYRSNRWKDKPLNENQGFWTIVLATGLTFNDLQTTGALSDASTEMLELLWTTQREDGGWRWPDCDYAPMELDEHFGVTLAALTVGIAPDNYAESSSAKRGIEKLKTFLKNDPPKSLHHRTMIAWSSIRIEGIATEAERKETLREFLSLQLPDGGWSTSGFLADWEGLVAEGDPPLDTKTSDGYGTGFAILVARELGVPADDPRLQKGIAWINSNQRESGKWFTPSPVVYAENLISNTGSAYIILALQACGKLPGSPLGK